MVYRFCPHKQRGSCDDCIGEWIKEDRKSQALMDIGERIIKRLEELKKQWENAEKTHTKKVLAFASEELENLLKSPPEASPDLKDFEDVACGVLIDLSKSFDYSFKCRHGKCDLLDGSIDDIAQNCLCMSHDGRFQRCPDLLIELSPDILKKGGMKSSSDSEDGCVTSQLGDAQ